MIRRTNPGCDDTPLSGTLALTHPSRIDPSSPSYVLVTPARNEATFLSKTIASMLAQTIVPREWVIVSDGSTDGTDQLVRDATVQAPWIRLLPLVPRDGHSFAAVVHNTEKGIRSLECQDYDFLGLLDADVAFQPDYFERLIGRFAENPRLGLAGGVVIDVGLPRDEFPRNREDVPGAVQFFRRACFERLGGLLPIPEGGWDTLTCAAARMNGYETRLLTDLVVDHLKPRNVSQGGVLRRKWQLGVRDYACGYLPLFEMVKCAGRLAESPMLVATIARAAGFWYATIAGKPRVVPSQLIDHVREEQWSRLRRAVGLRS